MSNKLLIQNFRISGILVLVVAFLFHLTFPFQIFGGSLVGWGNDFYGHIDDLPSGTNFVAVDAGYKHNLALKSDGSLMAWGNSTYGQVYKAPSGKDFIAISAGIFHSVVLKSDGSLVSWGRDLYGEVSDTPTETGFIAVSAGYNSNVALKSDGSLVAWGMDDFGQVSDTPSGTGFTAISAGYSHNLALKSDGSLIAWGHDGNNQVSDTPSETVYTAISAGYNHNLALKSDGSLVVWGNNSHDQVSNTPTETGFILIAAGGNYNVALQADGSMVVWGSDIDGQVSGVPTGSGFFAVSAESHHSVAIATEQEDNRDPSVTLLSPKETIFQNKPTFVWTVDDPDNDSVTCTLYISGDSTPLTDPLVEKYVGNDSQYTLSSEELLGPGNFSWAVKINDGHEHVITSIIQSLKVWLDKLDDFETVNDAWGKEGDISFVDDGSGDNRVCRMSESSDASISQTLTLSNAAGELVFDYHFVHPGDGDSLVATVNDAPVWSMPGTAYSGTNMTSSGLIDLSDWSGQTVDLKLRLSSTGQKNCQIWLDNVIIVASFFDNMTIGKMAIKAGKTRSSSSDSIAISGSSFDAKEISFSHPDTMIYLDILSRDEEFPVLSDKFKVSEGRYKKGIFTRKHKDSSGRISSLKFDLNKNKFYWVQKKVNLSRLSGPVLVEIEAGDYLGTSVSYDGEAFGSGGNLDVINGKKPIPIQFMMGFHDSLRLDKYKFKLGTRKPNTDSLTLQGAIAVEYPSVNIALEDILVRWGDYEILLPANNLYQLNRRKTFRYKKPKGSDSSVSGAVFDLDKCTFKIIIKNADIGDQGNSLNFGLKFGSFTETETIAVSP